jgi:hypothetical protein
MPPDAAVTVPGPTPTQRWHPMSKPDDFDSTTHGFYSPVGMRRLSAKAQFGSDWDLRLTEEQEELLAKYGPVFKPAFDGHVRTGDIEVFRKPCPPHLRRQLDEALGLDRRIRIQNNMIDDLLLSAGFKLTSRVLYESWKVEEVIARYQAQKAAVATPRPAPGTLKRHADSDRALFDDVKRLMDEGMSLTAATLKLANDNRVAGTGVAESRARRLANLYRAEQQRKR